MNLAMPTDVNNGSGGHRRKLGYFVLGSLVLHLMVAGLWRGEPPAGPVGQSTFKVTLLARHGDTESVRVAVIENAGKTGTTTPAGSTQHHRKPAASTEDQRQELRAITQHIAQMRLVTQAAVQTGQKSGGPGASVPGPLGKALGAEGARVADRVVHLVRSQPSSSRGSRTHGEHELTSEAKYRQVRAALNQALLPIFEYPHVARRRGWQGRVKVGLYLEAGGDLSRVYLVESSGHSLLDKAAVKNVTSLRNVPAATQWLDSSGMEVVLPVSYQLDNP
jgi:TonB family protein